MVTTVLAILATVAIWANRQMLNPDNWSRTSTQLLQNAPIRTATANYLTDQLYNNVDVAGLISSGLPKQLQGLAAPAAGALRNAAVQGIELALSRPHVQALWAEANRQADQALVTVVNGGSDKLKINNGEVTLDLRNILNDAAGRLGLSNTLGNKLPASAAELTILRSDQIKLVQDAGGDLRGLALALNIIVPLLYLLAIVIAKGRRRRTLLSVGVSGIVAGVVVFLARSLIVSQVPKSLVNDSSVRPAAQAVTSIATSTLAEIAGAVILIGVVVVIAAWFAGPSRWSTAGRHAIAPFLREHPAETFGIVAVLMLLIFIWQPIPATGTWLGMLVFFVLAMVGTEALRRQIQQET